LVIFCMFLMARIPKRICLLLSPKSWHLSHVMLIKSSQVLLYGFEIAKDLTLRVVTGWWF
jgi:hypothetical protein